jgi:hypothetical protein
MPRASSASANPLDALPQPIRGRVARRAPAPPPRAWWRARARPSAHRAPRRDVPDRRRPRPPAESAGTSRDHHATSASASAQVRRGTATPGPMISAPRRAATSRFCARYTARADERGAAVPSAAGVAAGGIGTGGARGHDLASVWRCLRCSCCGVGLGRLGGRHLVGPASATRAASRAGPAAAPRRPSSAGPRSAASGACPQRRQPEPVEQARHRRRRRRRRRLLAVVVPRLGAEKIQHGTFPARAASRRCARWCGACRRA